MNSTDADDLQNATIVYLKHLEGRPVHEPRINLLQAHF
jgi:hypothetical protein